MPRRIAHENGDATLRSRVAQLRRDLSDTTKAYRAAVARHDSAKAIPLLRLRSQLMRQLLDTQCQLLLSLRSETPDPAITQAAPAT